MIDFSSLFCGIFINRNCRVRNKTLARTLGYHQSLPPSSKFAARPITCPTGRRLTHINHFIWGIITSSCPKSIENIVSMCNSKYDVDEWNYFKKIFRRIVQEKLLLKIYCWRNIVFSIGWWRKAWDKMFNNNGYDAECPDLTGISWERVGGVTLGASETFQP